MADIKETNDVLVALLEVGVFVVKEMKAKKALVTVASDFVDAILVHPEFKQKLVAAYENISLVSDEMADLSFVEGLSLGKTVISYIPAFFAAMKG